MPRSIRTATGSTPRAENAALAVVLRELAARLELDGVEHAPRAYRRAADTVERQQRSLPTLYQRKGVSGLESLPGIGEHIAETLREQIETGRIARLEHLRRATGVDVLGLLAVDGVGPKRLRTLWRELHVRDVADLEHAVAQKKVRDLPGFGARTEERLHDTLQLRRRGPARMPLARAARTAERLRAELDRDVHVQRACVAGSIRRGAKTVGDVDLVVASDDAQAVADAFLSRAQIAQTHAKGPHRVSLTLESGVDVDLRIVPPDSFGSALLYFTGNRAHTIALRQLALAQGLRLNEYGLFRGKQKIAGDSEEEIYAALSLPFIAPDARQGGDEIREALQSERGRTA